MSKRSSVDVESEASKKEKSKRNGNKFNEKKNLLFAVGESEKTVYRRTTLNSQNTPYTCEQLIEPEFKQTQRKRVKKSPATSESISRTDSMRHVIEREFSDKISETQSSRYPNMIDNEPSTSDVKTSSNKTDILISEVTNKVKAVMMTLKETKPVSNFKQQAETLTKKFRELEDLLVSYLLNQNSAMAISNLIQDCLNEFSVEHLSSSELMEYLLNDMGKLLHSLLVILEEFEFVAKESNVTVHSTVIHSSSGYYIAKTMNFY